MYQIPMQILMDNWQIMSLFKRRSALKLLCLSYFNSSSAVI